MLNVCEGFSFSLGHVLVLRAASFAIAGIKSIPLRFHVLLLKAASCAALSGLLSKLLLLKLLLKLKLLQICTLKSRGRGEMGWVRESHNYLDDCSCKALLRLAYPCIERTGSD